MYGLPGFIMYIGRSGFTNGKYSIRGDKVDMSTINLFVFLHNKQQTKVCPINYCNKQ